MVHRAAKYLLLMACPALLGQSLVREEKTVEVDGVSEIWRLQWKSAPRPACAVNDADAFNCPCAGFAYGEQGPIDLVRIRDGREIDRLPLTPFFKRDGGWGEAIVQRWPRLPSDNIGSDARVLEKTARARGVVTIMDFTDYDHDGQATEFFLQTGTRPCGKQIGVVIGLSPGKRKLHAFGKPFYLQKRQWDALRSSAGPVRVMDDACGDHGAMTEIEIELEADGTAIKAWRREYGCTEKGRGKLLTKTQL